MESYDNKKRKRKNIHCCCCCCDCSTTPTHTTLTLPLVFQILGPREHDHKLHTCTSALKCMFYNEAHQKWRVITIKKEKEKTYIVAVVVVIVLPPLLYPTLTLT